MDLICGQVPYARPPLGQLHKRPPAKSVGLIQAGHTPGSTLVRPRSSPHNDDLDLLHPSLNQPNTLRCSFREVDDAALAPSVGAAVIDRDDHILTRPEIRDLHL